MCDRQRLSLKRRGLEMGPWTTGPSEDPDRSSFKQKALRASLPRRGDEAARRAVHQQPDNGCYQAAQGSAKESLQAARLQDRRALLRPQPRSRCRACAFDLASWKPTSRTCDKAAACLATSTGHNLLTLLRLPRRALEASYARPPRIESTWRADMAVFSCCSRPPGPCWSALGVSQRRPWPRFSNYAALRSSGSESRRKARLNRTGMITEMAVTQEEHMTSTPTKVDYDIIAPPHRLRGTHDIQLPIALLPVPRLPKWNQQ